jgi:hypothetical protein
MKKIILLAVILSSLNSFAQSLCERMARGQIVEDGYVDLLNQDNWYSVDVINALDYRECKDAIRQEMILFEGQHYYRFRSYEDDCDGGNTYGSIVSLDLKEIIAHIYDGDLVCEKKYWRPEYLRYNNRCNMQAEQLSIQKMKQLNLDFIPEHTQVTVRTPYTFSFLDVDGRLENFHQKRATVRVWVRLDSCQLSRSQIQYLDLEVK